MKKAPRLVRDYIRHFYNPAVEEAENVYAYIIGNPDIDLDERIWQSYDDYKRRVAPNMPFYEFHLYLKHRDMWEYIL